MTGRCPFSLLNKTDTPSCKYFHATLSQFLKVTQSLCQKMEKNLYCNVVSVELLDFTFSTSKGSIACFVQRGPTCNIRVSGKTRLNHSLEHCLLEDRIGSQCLMYSRHLALDSELQCGPSSLRARCTVPSTYAAQKKLSKQNATALRQESRFAYTLIN